MSQTEASTTHVGTIVTVASADRIANDNVAESSEKPLKRVENDLTTSGLWKSPHKQRQNTRTYYRTTELDTDQLFSNKMVKVIKN